MFLQKQKYPYITYTIQIKSKQVLKAIFNQYTFSHLQLKFHFQKMLWYCLIYNWATQSYKIIEKTQFPVVQKFFKNQRPNFELMTKENMLNYKNVNIYK